MPVRIMMSVMPVPDLAIPGSLSGCRREFRASTSAGDIEGRTEAMPTIDHETEIVAARERSRQTAAIRTQSWEYQDRALALLRAALDGELSGEQRREAQALLAED